MSHWTPLHGSALLCTPLHSSALLCRSCMHMSDLPPLFSPNWAFVFPVWSLKSMTHCPMTYNPMRQDKKIGGSWPMWLVLWRESCHIVARWPRFNTLDHGSSQSVPAGWCEHVHDSPQVRFSRSQSESSFQLCACCSQWWTFEPWQGSKN